MSRGDISRCGHCPAKELVNEAAEGEGGGGKGDQPGNCHYDII